MIYADYNATAPLRPEARAAISNALDISANPSSVHRAGRKARKIVENSRAKIATAIGASSSDIIFTSGGTEAVASGIRAILSMQQINYKVLVNSTEHDCVQQNIEAHSNSVVSLPVHPCGLIDLTYLEETLARLKEDSSSVPILFLMLANNETGVIQPVAEAARLVREAGGLTFCDAVQGLGKIDVNVSILGVDYLVLSAHKVGGPQGVGALWRRSNAPLQTLLAGGGQEKSMRSGTENLSGIAGFGAAVEVACSTLADYQSLADYRDAMEEQLKKEAGVVVAGQNVVRLAGVSNFACSGFRSETQVMAMDLAGVAISSGAACSSGKVRRSKVLSSMGYDDDLANCAIRASFGWNSRQTDFEQTTERWLKVMRRVKHKGAA